MEGGYLGGTEEEKGTEKSEGYQSPLGGARRRWVVESWPTWSCRSQGPNLRRSLWSGEELEAIPLCLPGGEGRQDSRWGWGKGWRCGGREAQNPGSQASGKSRTHLF